MNVSVGDSFAQDGKPVFAIFATDRAVLILISTYGPPPVDDPIQVPLQHVLDVEEFTALRQKGTRERDVCVCSDKGRKR
jgi:hypothetical protein